MRQLVDRAPWRQEWISLYGRRVPVPRLVAWCGDAGINYRYSGADHPCDGWLPELAALRRQLSDATGLACNFVLINRYRHGAEYMGWHSDDERGLASTVASISLGACRRFLFRPKSAAAMASSARTGPAGSRRPSQVLELAHGSLLMLDGSVRHSLPATRKPVGERINLTFRLLEEGR